MQKAGMSDGSWNRHQTLPPSVLRPCYLHFSEFSNSLGRSQPTWANYFKYLVSFPRIIYDCTSRGATGQAPWKSPSGSDWFSQCIFSWIPLPVVRYVSFGSFRMFRWSGDEEAAWRLSENTRERERKRDEDERRRQERHDRKGAREMQVLPCSRNRLWLIPGLSYMHAWKAERLLW